MWSVNHRWNSPKFLFGESYGTTRSAALVDALQNSGMYFNGVILMSSILNYFTLAPGSDALFIGNLPSYAAIAWHYEKISHKGKDEKAFLDEVRAFARGPYAEALAQGQNLPQAQVDAIAAKLSSYTGLSAAYIKEANLRVSPARFRKELLRDRREIVGRYDARFEGTDVDAAGETPGYDPVGRRHHRRLCVGAARVSGPPAEVHVERDVLAERTGNQSGLGSFPSPGVGRSDCGRRGEASPCGMLTSRVIWRTPSGKIRGSEYSP